MAPRKGDKGGGLQVEKGQAHEEWALQPQHRTTTGVLPALICRGSLLPWQGSAVPRELSWGTEQRQRQRWREHSGEGGTR